MITQLPVLARKAAYFYVASPADFTLGEERAIDAIPADATPYCVDFKRRCLLCVRARGVFEHPFLYQAQRAKATAVVRIPFAELPGGTVSPALIFSPGRCGSTLLLKILQAAGLPCVSEPDCFRQIATVAATKKQPRELLQRLLRAVAGMLGGALGSAAPVIKLQLSCNVAPLLISRSFPSPRVIFILRERRGWARSLKRLAPEMPAQEALQTLNLALWALDRLAGAHDLRICNYADFSQPDAAYVRDLAAFLGRDLTLAPEALRAVLEQDSQEDTTVGRAALAGRSAEPAFLEEFERLWQAGRRAAIIDKHALAGRL